MASEIRVNQIQNRSGLGTVTFTDTGAVLSGIVTVAGNLKGPSEVDATTVTATTITGTTVKVGTAVTISAGVVTATSFSGDGSGLSGIDASSLKSGGVVKVQANSSGAVISGVATATQITVGDSFLKQSAVGLGTTTSTARDAGISTAAGTMIYIPDTGMQVYAGDTRGWRTVASTDDNFVQEITGGTKTTVGSRTYHTFTSSGTLTVQNMTKTANFLVVAGGGGGGNWAVPGAGGNGGGGAGGVVAGNALPLADGGTYTITVGGGGASTGLNPTVPSGGNKGGANSTIASPLITTITAKGGGEGGDDETDLAQPGGSGGGAGGSNAYNNTGSATQPGTNSLYGATDYGNAGGQGIPASPYNSGGGGGAGAVGGAGNPSLAGAGGVGQPFGLDYTPTDNGTTGPAPGRYFGGGGGGSGYNDNNTQNLGGAGGGAPGHQPGDPGPRDGTANTGGGGGGGRTASSGISITMNGGSGIVIISYT